MLRRFVVPLLALLPVLGFSGCDGDGGSPTAPSPERTVITQGGQSGIPSFPQTGLGFFVIVQTTVAGALEGTVDWTFQTSPVTVGWARGDCRTNPDCAPITTDSTAVKPKTVTASGLQAGTYSLVVINNSFQEESISYTVVLVR